MKKFLIAALISFSPLAFAGAAPQADVASAVHVIDYQPTSGDLQAQLSKIASDAKAQGLTPYVQFTADWCSHCKKLAASLGDPLMVNAFAGTYIVRLDYDAWGPKMKALGFKSVGVPIIFAIDKHGKPTGKTIDGGAWGEDTAQNMAPPLKQFFAANKWSS